MQTPSPSEMIIFTWKICETGEKLIKIYCAETGEKLIFRFSFFKLWLIMFTIFFTHLNFQVFSPTKNKKIPSKVAIFIWKMRNVIKRIKKNNFSIFAIFNFWNMIVKNVTSWVKERILLNGLFSLRVFFCDFQLLRYGPFCTQHS